MALLRGAWYRACILVLQFVAAIERCRLNRPEFLEAFASRRELLENLQLSEQFTIDNLTTQHSYLQVSPLGR